MTWACATNVSRRGSAYRAPRPTKSVRISAPVPSFSSRSVAMWVELLAAPHLALRGEVDQALHDVDAWDRREKRVEESTIQEKRRRAHVHRRRPRHRAKVQKTALQRGRIKRGIAAV